MARLTSLRVRLFGFAFCGFISVLALGQLRAVAQGAAGDDSDGAANSGRARATAAQQDIETSQQARLHFGTGMEHFQAREFRPAIQEFEIAARLVPSADLWFNIARAHEELADYSDAVEFYQRYLRDRVDPPDGDEVRARIERLRAQAEADRLAEGQRPTTGTLRLRASQPGAEIALDGSAVGTSPMDVPMPVEPGSHRVELTRDGYVPFRAQVDVERGVTSAAFAQLEPATRYRAIRGRRLFTWIAGGLAVASTGLAVGFGAHAASLESDGDPRASNWARSSDYALGGAMVLGLGALILYFVEGRSVGTERVTPDAEPTGDASSGAPPIGRTQRF